MSQTIVRFHLPQKQELDHYKRTHFISFFAEDSVIYYNSTQLSVNLVTFDSNAFSSSSEQICYADFDLAKSEKIVVPEISDLFGLYYDKKSELLMLQFEKDVHVYQVNNINQTTSLKQKFQLTKPSEPIDVCVLGDNVLILYKLSSIFEVRDAKTYQK